VRNEPGRRQSLSSILVVVRNARGQKFGRFLRCGCSHTAYQSAINCSNVPRAIAHHAGCLRARRQVRSEFGPFLHASGPTSASRRSSLRRQRVPCGYDPSPRAADRGKTLRPSQLSAALAALAGTKSAHWEQVGLPSLDLPAAKQLERSTVDLRVERLQRPSHASQVLDLMMLG
jgi:hypothetical protein